MECSHEDFEYLCRFVLDKFAFQKVYAKVRSYIKALFNKSSVAKEVVEPLIFHN